MIVKKQENRPYTLQDAPMCVRSVRLTFWHIRRAKRIGSGNLSEGVRIAIECTDTVKGLTNEHQRTTTVTG